MNESRAFEILGINPTSSEDEILSRFRDLAKQIHPDKGGVNYDMSELLLARETAITAIRNRSLVPVSAIKEIIRANTDAILKKQELQAENIKTKNQIIRHQTSRFKRYKRMAAFCGSISAAMTALTSGFIGSLTDRLSTIIDSNIILYLIFTINPFFYFLITALIGLVYYITSTMVENIERSIEELNDTFDDKSYFVTFFQEIFGKSNIDPLWTRPQLEHYVNNWIMDKTTNQNLVLKLFEQLLNNFHVIHFFLFPSSMNKKELVRFIGLSDFVKLLISKGLEKELIIEKTRIDDGKFLVQYSFTFVPS